MNQAGHKWLAASASVLLHFLVLSVFAMVGFNYEKTSPIDNKPQHQLKIEYVKNAIQNPPLMDKPKFHNSLNKSFDFKPLPIEQPTKFPKNKSNNQIHTPVNAKIDTADFNIDEDFNYSGVNFFSAKSRGRRVCFLVDCSGSMQGLWPTVKAELLHSIDSLLADQYFSIVFFGNNTIVEFPKDRLARASAQNKKRAKTFIQLTKPGGQTNALAGFNKAVKIRDAYLAGSDVIFFLTDGFELTGKNAADFALAVIGLVQDNLPTVKINTIAFWPNAADRKLLKNIADLTGGDFVIINDDNL